MSKFRVPTTVYNPCDNTMIFEEYFGIKYKGLDEKLTNRIYLPVYWTNYYISKNYGKDDMSNLQGELDALPREFKYFTIVQYDDGVLQNISNLDLFIYGQGGPSDYILPLNCLPHGVREDDKFKITPTLASFVGSIEGRHPVREKMAKVFADEKRCIIEDRRGKESFNYFLETMRKSKFSLCPRGYGATSFRICEALDVGSIPVYIYDKDPLIPFEDILDFNSYGVLCSEENLEHLPDYLRELEKDEELMNQLQKNGERVYNIFYSYDGCMAQILKHLERNN